MKRTDPARDALLAAMLFARLSGEKDQVGVASFGTTLSRPIFSTREHGVDEVARKIRATDYSDQCTDFYLALTGATEFFVTGENAPARRAVILLTDGLYDPSGKHLGYFSSPPSGAGVPPSDAGVRAGDAGGGDLSTIRKLAESAPCFSKAFASSSLREKAYSLARTRLAELAAQLQAREVDISVQSFGPDISRSLDDPEYVDAMRAMLGPTGNGRFIESTGEIPIAFLRILSELTGTPDVEKAIKLTSGETTQTIFERDQTNRKLIVPYPVPNGGTVSVSRCSSEEAEDPLTPTDDVFVEGPEGRKGFHIYEVPENQRENICLSLKAAEGTEWLYFKYFENPVTIQLEVEHEVLKQTAAGRVKIAVTPAELSEAFRSQLEVSIWLEGAGKTLHKWERRDWGIQAPHRLELPVLPPGSYTVEGLLRSRSGLLAVEATPARLEVVRDMRVDLETKTIQSEQRITTPRKLALCSIHPRTNLEYPVRLRIDPREVSSGGRLRFDESVELPKGSKLATVSGYIDDVKGLSGDDQEFRGTLRLQNDPSFSPYVTGTVNWSCEVSVTSRKWTLCDHLASAARWFASRTGVPALYDRPRDAALWLSSKTGSPSLACILFLVALVLAVALLLLVVAKLLPLVWSWLSWFRLRPRHRSYGRKSKPFGKKPKPLPDSPKGKINAHLAGKKHPKTNVPFDRYGNPDFSGHLHPDMPELRDEQLEYRSRSEDVKRANMLAGFSETPRGYVWHHSHERGVMQLVKREIHAATAHTGGFGMFH